MQCWIRIVRRRPSTSEEHATSAKRLVCSFTAAALIPVDCNLFCPLTNMGAPAQYTAADRSQSWHLQYSGLGRCCHSSASGRCSRSHAYSCTVSPMHARWHVPSHHWDMFRFCLGLLNMSYNWYLPQLCAQQSSSAKSYPTRY